MLLLRNKPAAVEAERMLNASLEDWSVLDDFSDHFAAGSQVSVDTDSLEFSIDPNASGFAIGEGVFFVTGDLTATATVTRAGISIIAFITWPFSTELEPDGYSMVFEAAGIDVFESCEEDRRHKVAPPLPRTLVSAMSYYDREASNPGWAYRLHFSDGHEESGELAVACTAAGDVLSPVTALGDLIEVWVIRPKVGVGGIEYHHGVETPGGASGESYRWRA